MSDDAKGGVALLAATAAGLVTMALHPTPHQVFGGPDPHRAAQLGVLVHGLAIASAPVSFLGALALYRRTADPARLSLAALVCYGFSLFAVTVAAAASGFLATGLALAPEPAPRTTLLLVALLNQGFAKIDVVASSAGIFLWSLAIWRGRTLPRGIAAYGFVLAPAVAALVVTGSLRLDVHGFGLVVLLQGIWVGLVGIWLLRPARLAVSRSNEV
jgi:hypothetical protein